MFEIIERVSIDKSVKSIFFIGLILLLRKRLNVKSIKYANMILWSLLFGYLLFPFNLQINIERSQIVPVGRSFAEGCEKILDCFENSIKIMETVLFRRNRFIVAALCLFYMAIQIIKMKRKIRASEIIRDERANSYIELFHLKRKVQIMVNDKIKVPITYGILKPKIIIQSRILENDTVLKYVILHEMTHIKKFDVIFNHLKYMIVCIHWYNILILAICKYVEDMEILCDKLVMKRVGETDKNKKEYLEVMLELLEIDNTGENRISLKLHPTLERMRVMKRYKVSVAGVLCLILVSMIHITAFAKVVIHDTPNKVVSSVDPVEEKDINEGGKTKEISEEEYGKLIHGASLLLKLKSANIDSSESLDGFESKIYQFDISSVDTADHDGFTVKFSKISCGDNPEYKVIIQENSRIIYKKTFKKAVSLKTKAKKNSKYKVAVFNQTPKELKFDIAINSYVR